MKRIFLLLSVFAIAFSISACKQKEPSPERPKILNLSHVAYYTKDVDATMQLFTEYLGFPEIGTLTNDDGGIRMKVVKFNDDQFIEILPENNADTERFLHYALETDDLEGMRRYLISKGWEAPDKLNTGNALGVDNFFITDPNEHLIEFVQYAPGGIIAENKGVNLPETRTADRLHHVAINTPDPDKALAFYQDILGFNEVWRGSSIDGVVEWLYMQVPDGTDHVELMLYDHPLSYAEKNHMNHICLEAKDVIALEQLLETKQLPENSNLTGLIVGTNNIRQISVYNPDAIRVEIMEAGTVDGLAPTFQDGELLRFNSQD